MGCASAPPDPGGPDLRALDPLVARLTTAAVPCAPRSDRPRPSQVIGDALGLLVHG
jgi:hypothetical protein